MDICVIESDHPIASGKEFYLSSIKLWPDQTLTSCKLVSDKIIWYNITKW